MFTTTALHSVIPLSYYQEYFLQLREALIFCTFLESEGPSGTMCHHFDGILETLTLSRPTCMFFRHICRPLFNKRWQTMKREGKGPRFSFRGRIFEQDCLDSLSF